MASRLGKIPTTSVRRRISRLSRSVGLLDQICRHTSPAERGEGEQVFAGVAEVVGDLGQPAFGVLQQPVELGVDGLSGGLVIDAAGASLSPPATCSWGGWP